MIRPKLLILFIVIMLSLGFNNFIKAESNEQAISADLIKEEFLKTNFPELLYNTRKLPTEIKKIFSGHDVLANPGERFNNSDVVEGLFPAPSRQLIFAGETGNVAFVYYQQGGFVSYYTLALFMFDGKRGISLRSIYVLKAKRANDLNELKLLVKDYAEKIE